MNVKAITIIQAGARIIKTKTIFNIHSFTVSYVNDFNNSLEGRDIGKI